MQPIVDTIPQKSAVILNFVREKKRRERKPPCVKRMHGKMPKWEECKDWSDEKKSQWLDDFAG